MERLKLSYIAMLFAVGCGSQPSQPAQPTPDANDPAPVNDQRNGPPAPPEATVAKGWSELIINANSAKTTVSPFGHFATTRNACGKDAFGVVVLADWNSLAKNLNLAVEGTPAPQEYCVAIPESYPYMNDSVQVKLERETRTLYELKNGQICSNIQDHATADALLADVQKMILVADKEECPNGWGSA
jgi:hypothetical protein